MNSKISWLIYWLFFCLGLFVVYLFLNILDKFRENRWKRFIRESHLLIKKRGKFNKKYCNKIQITEMKDMIDVVNFNDLIARTAWFELFDEERILFFEIPWGEVYCQGSVEEYAELIKQIEHKFINEVSSVSEN